MPKIVRLPSDALIVVCDARKALFLTNSGPVAAPHLQIEASIASPHDSGQAQDADRPGRRFDGGAAAAAGGARSAMQTSDLQARAEEDLADTVISALTARQSRQPVRALVLAAPQSLLGVLRRKLPTPLKQLVTAELDKDLAGMPLPALEKVLLNSL